MKIEIKLTDDSGKLFQGEIDLKPIGKKVSRKLPVSKPGKRVVKGTLPARIGALIDTGYFKKPKTADDVKAELKLQGFHYNLDQVSMALLRTVRRMVLRRVTEKKGNKTIYKYVNA